MMDQKLLIIDNHLMTPKRKRLPCREASTKLIGKKNAMYCTTASLTVSTRPGRRTTLIAGMLTVRWASKVLDTPGVQMGC